MMMMMKNPFVLVICTLLFSSLAVLASYSSFEPQKCCTDFVSVKLRRDRVESYAYTDERCSMKGVYFTMKNGNDICANPSEQWVKNLIKAKDRLLATK